jgi:hypothetical protein
MKEKSTKLIEREAENGANKPKQQVSDKLGNSRMAHNLPMMALQNELKRRTLEATGTS